MSKYFLLLFLLIALTAVLIIGCRGGPTSPGNSNPPYAQWQASVATGATWLTVTNGTNNGTGTFTLITSANTDTVARTATVVVAGTGTNPVNDTIQVTQAATHSTLLAVAPSAWYPNYSASSTMIRITVSGVDTSAHWAVVSGSTWLTVSQASGTGNGTFTLSATANADTAFRSGKVTITGTGTTPSSQSFMVMQAGQNTSPTLKLSTHNWVASSAVSSQIVTVNVSVVTDVIFITNSRAATLSVLDMASGFSRTADVGLDDGANDIQIRPGTNELWVLHSTNPDIKRYNIPSNKTLAPTYFSPPLALDNGGVNSNPYSLAFTNSGQYFYVTNSLDNSVMIRRSSDGVLFRRLVVGQYPEGVTVLPNGKVVVANTGFINLGVYATGNVMLCDSALTDTILHGNVGINPQVIKYYNNALYVICTGDYGSVYSTLWKLDPVTLQSLAAPITLTGAFASDLAIDVDYSAGVAWGVLPAWSMTGNSGAVYVVNLTTWSLQQTISPIDGGPSRTVALPHGGTATTLFSANQLFIRLRNGTTYVVNTGDGPYALTAASR